MAALHAAYPFGLYTITGSGGSAGTATAYIDYRHDYFTNTIPYVTNFSALNGLNPAANFTVDFNSFTPNSHVTEGFTFLTITDVSTGVAVVNDDFLTPTTMSALISAGTLLPDTLTTMSWTFQTALTVTTTAAVLLPRKDLTCALTAPLRPERLRCPRPGSLCCPGLPGSVSSAFGAGNETPPPDSQLLDLKTPDQISAKTAASRPCENSNGPPRA